MLIEKMFGNTFGMIWLIVFLVAIIALIVWLLMRKDRIIEEDSSIENKEDETIKEEIVKEEAVEEKVVNKEYEIIESEDGFFRVRKIGSERTLRKFATSKEAEDFVKEKESK